MDKPIQGIYEQLITELLAKRLSNLNDTYYIDRETLEPAEAAIYLSRFISRLIFLGLDSLTDADNGKVEKQVLLSNHIINVIRELFKNQEISDDLIETKGQLLKAVFSKNNPVSSNFPEYIKRIVPESGLTQSNLFTGSNVGISLESELKKEIMSADEIWWLVSFVKWTGIRIFANELEEFTRLGKKLKIITTTYMGATDFKAIEYLTSLSNIELKVSYNSKHERLHAKAYLFLRNNGYDTGYIGSSNISRSALTDGLEWNMKITTQEVPQILSKFKSTFETYWSSREFESYNPADVTHREKIKKAIALASGENTSDDIVFFDLEPHPYQKEILEKLRTERILHNRYRNLVVAATGTGKTMIAAFDFRRIFREQQNTKLLYVTHREEILTQARKTFRAVLRQNAFGELWVGSYRPQNCNQLFVSVQTLNNNLESLSRDASFYDFIIVDEVHHIPAKSYREFLARFKPKILLGLTATPERHDNEDILKDFCGTIAAELRLPEAINRGYLCRFQYFGLEDTVDLSGVSWIKGKYAVSELTDIYTNNDARVNHIVRNVHNTVTEVSKIKALCFCASQAHAEYMCQKFLLKGYSCSVLTSTNAEERVELRNKLVSGKINFLFVVDIFNEGVDIPEIDTVLFLRPTESLTIFLQQLGRGLRLTEGKDCLTVLDFVGNARPEYDFSHKYRALIGKTHTSVKDEIEKGFPHLPLGCSIVLHEQAKEHILKNISSAIANKKNLLSSLASYRHKTSLPLTIKNFIYIYPNYTLDDIYKVSIGKGGGWTRLLIEAGLISATLDADVESAIHKGLFRRIMTCTSFSYLNFLKNFFTTTTEMDLSDSQTNQFALMMHYDFWQVDGPDLKVDSLTASLNLLRKSNHLVDDAVQVINYLIENIDIEEKPLPPELGTVLSIHARYSRDAILAAFEENSFSKKSSSREGVVLIKGKNLELLFVTLHKTQKNFSSTTMYHDYAINEVLFHWQSQNSARPDKGKGKSYIEQAKNKKDILLFVREKNNDEYGRAMGFVNLGLVNFVTTNGAQPMNITWRLHEPLPPFIWGEAAKLASA